MVRQGAARHRKANPVPTSRTTSSTTTRPPTPGTIHSDQTANSSMRLRLDRGQAKLGTDHQGSRIRGQVYCSSHRANMEVQLLPVPWCLRSIPPEVIISKQPLSRISGAFFAGDRFWKKCLAWNGAASYTAVVREDPVPEIYLDRSLGFVKQSAREWAGSNSGT